MPAHTNCDIDHNQGGWIVTNFLKNFGLAMALGLVAIGGSATALAKPTYTGLFGNVAAGGYDVTSYFIGKGIPQKGNKAFAVVYNGATYYFTSKANADTFKASPAKYAPQYGGYCAWAMAGGSKAPGDPEYYRVVDGKLYLNYNKGVQDKWNKDIAGFIKQANGEWQKIS
jgi:YHS domain-containing protein